MGVTYDRFLQSGIDLSTLDIRAGDNSPYFCTPRGASIIGWTVNSVHFCFVHGCGETVFSVSPRAAAPDFLRAVARDFDSFLRLLLSCGSAAVLEQGARYPKEIFESNLEHAFLSEEARTTLAAIADTFRLDPMPSPWDYMSELHQGFDYSAIAFTDPGPEVLHINDCCDGSQPRPTGVSGEGRTSPQYSFYLVPNLPDRYCTFSSRYFDPAEQIEWQPTFMVKRHGPFELTLI